MLHLACSKNPLIKRGIFLPLYVGRSGGGIPFKNKGKYENSFMQAFEKARSDASQALRYSGGKAANRNKHPLTDKQRNEVIEYATKELGIPREKLKFYSNDQPTCYSDLFDVVFVGRDVYPNPLSKSALDRVSMKATMAHEIVGHRQTTLLGKDFSPGSLLDEVQASYRAARLAPGINTTERYQLLRDVVRRLHLEGYDVKSFKMTDYDKMFLESIASVKPDF